MGILRNGLKEMDKFTFFWNKDKQVKPASNPGNAAWKRSMQAHCSTLPLHTETLENHKTGMNDDQKKSSASDFSMRRSSHEAEYSDWMRKQNYMRDNKN